MPTSHIASTNAGASLVAVLDGVQAPNAEVAQASASPVVNVG